MKQMINLSFVFEKIGHYVLNKRNMQSHVTQAITGLNLLHIINQISMMMQQHFK